MERLLDERDRDIEAALLRAGKDVELSSAGRTKLLMVLGVSTSLAVGTKAAAAAGLLGKLSASKVSLMASIAAAGAVGAGVYYGVSDSGSYDEERPVIAVQATNRAPAQGEAPPVRQVRERGAQGAETKVADSEASAQEAEHQTVQSRARKATKQRTTGKSTDGATLGEELALVESASRATKAGNARLALERLAEYQRKFPRGKLALEAQVIRIEALARAGRRAEASRLARSFLKRHPKSPIGARISRYAE